jgi:hypothetical protein
MAILTSRTKTGISWVTESIALFKQSPRKWLILAMAYLSIFVLIPSVPGLQIFAFVSILIWPIFIAVAMRMYRNAEMQKTENLAMIMQVIQPNIRKLFALGFVCLFYFVIVSIILSTDVQSLAEIVNKQTQLTEEEIAVAIQAMIPILLKLTLLFIPLMMAVWFAPMLVAFNNYPLVKAMKSSVAGTLQYMVAMTAAWLLLTVIMVTMLMVLGVIVGVLSSMLPSMAQSLMTMLVFGCFLFSIALTLAFQYVSYRDIFRAAPIV